jgi:hypothetical protein
MITVEEVLKQNKKETKIAQEQNEELLKTGSLKANKQSYWLWIVLGAAAIVGAILLWRQGKKDNGTISDK